MTKKTILTKTLPIVIVLTLSPIIIFIFHFNSSNISNDIAHWGAFGSYIGGIVTPIISALSVIVLGYLTYLVSKTSTEENKNLFIQQKKIEAYDELSRLLVPFHLTFQRATQQVEKINSLKKQNIQEIENIYNNAEKFNNETYFFSEFHYSLYNFRTRYSHLFTYNFDSDNYLNLIQLSLELKNQHTSFYSAIINSNNDLLKPFNSMEELNRLLAQFLNQIRKEIV